MTMLSAVQLASMRATAAEAMPATGVVSRATMASDGMGGWSQTWGTVDTVSCRVSPPGNVRLDQWTEKIQNRTPYILDAEQGSDIEPGDQVTIGSETYLVVGIMVGSWEITRQMIVVLL